MVTPKHAQQLKDAEAKAASGDFARAISLYESALGRDFFLQIAREKS